MKKKITLLMSISPARKIFRLNVSKIILSMAGLIFVLSIVSLAVFICNYMILYGEVQKIEAMKTQSADQVAEIEVQMSQIRYFSKRLSDMGQNINELDNLENQIRTLSNLEHENSRNSRFGVGGSTNFNLAYGQPDPQIQYLESLIKTPEQKQVNEIQSLNVQKSGNNNTLPNFYSSVSFVFPVEKSPGERERSRVKYKGNIDQKGNLEIYSDKIQMVIASGHGIVTHTESDGSNGKTIIISHGHGMVSKYSNLESIDIKTGMTVNKGDTIAKTIISEDSSESFLCYALLMNGIPVNPEQFFLSY